jgi:hypothetical protein
MIVDFDDENLEELIKLVATASIRNYRKIKTLCQP